MKVHYIRIKPTSVCQIRPDFFNGWVFNFKAIFVLFTKIEEDYKDNVLIFSYPPTMNLVCIFTTKILKINTIYSLWELYPEIAERLR